MRCDMGQPMAHLGQMVMLMDAHVSAELVLCGRYFRLYFQ